MVNLVRGARAVSVRVVDRQTRLYHVVLPLPCWTRWLVDTNKRGVGFCKSMPDAILPFERVRKRKNLKPTDKIFGKSTRELMHSVLDELNLKFDRDGHIRTCYSLRHTYICLRLLEGAEIYQVARRPRSQRNKRNKLHSSLFTLRILMAPL